MASNGTDIINEINFTKRCILMSVISQEKNIILINSFHKIPIVKLFTADSTFENFVYSKIKGAFCLFMSKEKDPKNRKFFFRIYDINDYSLLFNMEIKKEYMQYITHYKDNFYFMELRQSFLGFQFLSEGSGRIFFLLLNEEPKKEIIEQNERAMNIKPKDISKTTNKVIDYIKTRLKYKFENAKTTTTNTTNYRRKDASSQKKEYFPSMIINDSKGEYLDTSIIPQVELLINNIEIDDIDSSISLFTEKNLNLEKCQKILKKYENNMENTVRRRNGPNIPINIIDKDCMNIINKQSYIDILIKNMLNNIRTQKRLDIFMQEHKKRHKGIPTGMNRRRTKGRLSKVGKRDSRISSIKMGSERSTMNESNSEDKNRRYSYNMNPALKYKSNNPPNNITTNNISTNIKMNAKSVDKENKGHFAKDKRKINSMQKTEMFMGMDDEDEIELDKGGFNYFTNDEKNTTTNNNTKKPNNTNIKKGVDIIEERPEDEEKDREHKYKKREIKLPSKYMNNINTNNIKTNITGNSNTNNIASRANVYKRPIAGKDGKSSMSNFLMGKGKK
jgi:hypothetical protein